MTKKQILENKIRQMVREEATQNELIDYYEKQLKKVLSSYGASGTKSDYFWNASYMLKAVEMGMDVADATKWASKKVKELNNETLKYVR